MAKLQRHRRKPGEYSSRKEAIRNMCLECMGYEMAEVKRCTATECHLYPWRLGMLDKEAIEKEKGEKQPTKKGGFELI